ncbi:MAG TPA: hypothetical protein VF746_02290 [Longimicrobium sp.]|jgi:hypothetical protein
MPTYQEVRERLKTGDLLLFSGTSAISTTIKFCSGGRWSHVGMVVRLPGRDEPFLWESTTLVDVPDAETGLARPGVQLVTVAERVATYRGEIMLRPLDRPLTPPMLARLEEVRHRFAETEFERSRLQQLRAAYDGPGGASPGEDLSSVFCSELVAEAYQAMGLLPEWPEGPPSNEYVPLDFCAERGLRLGRGYALGPEVPITAG